MSIKRIDPDDDRDTHRTEPVGEAKCSSSQGELELKRAALRQALWK